MTARPWIVADDEGPVSAREVGGKGENLLRLRGLGLRVPRFVIVGTRAFEETLGHARWLRAELEALEGADHEALAEGSARIAHRIREHGCPSGLACRLREQLARRGLDRAPLAVRSSAAGEDSAAHSFAGLLDSVLNVGAEEAAAAVAEVWASAFSPRSLAYRRRKGLGFERITTAVVIQELITPVASGVLFTCDPEDAARSLVVAAWGLGEGVVQSAVETDSYRIDRRSGEATATVAVKSERIVAGKAGGTRAEPVPEAQRGRRVLDHDQLERLRDLGLALEAPLRAPQDVEWATDAAGRLFLLQTRPIAPRGGERRVWDNSNIVESYPGLTRPLTFSFVRRAYAQAFGRAAREFFPLGSPVEPGVFERLLGLLDGRVYYNLQEWYAMFAHLARPERHRRTWDRMVGIAAQESPVEAAPRPLASRLLAALAALRVLLGVFSAERRFAARFAVFEARHRDAAEEQTPAQLVLRYRRIEQEAGEFWHLTLFNDFCAMRYHEALATLCRRGGHADLVNRLLAGEAGMESVATVRSLAALAERVRAEPLARELFEEGDDRRVWEELRRDPRLRSLRADFEMHLTRFGDRGLEELKLESATFREEPWRLVGLVRRHAQAGLAPAALEERERALRGEAEELACRCLSGPLQRLAFGFVLTRARAALRNRENMRFARGRLFGIVRRIFRRLGEQLVAAGFLDDGSDVFYLSVEEALGVVDGTSVTRDLRALVALRRSEYAGFARRDPGERVETTGIPQAASFVAEHAPAGEAGLLHGTGCSTGIASGTARVVLDPRTAAHARDQVLVARSTDPGWVFLMLSAAGLVAERGSLLSHTAIIGRELGIPTVVGVPGATALIPDGARLTIDGGTGDVRWA